jgi:hypothetical protein
VRPGLLRGLRPRLETFPEPFGASCRRCEQRRTAQTYVHGRLCDLKGNSAEASADLHDQERHALPKCVGQAPWDDRPLVAERARQVGAALGAADGVLVFDPAAVPNKGTEPVGVQRPW